MRRIPPPDKTESFASTAEAERDAAANAAIAALGIIGEAEKITSPKKAKETAQKAVKKAKEVAPLAAAADKAWRAIPGAKDDDAKRAEVMTAKTNRKDADRAVAEANVLLSDAKKIVQAATTASTQRAATKAEKDAKNEAAPKQASQTATEAANAAKETARGAREQALAIKKLANESGVKRAIRIASNATVEADTATREAGKAQTAAGQAATAAAAGNKAAAEAAHGRAIAARTEVDKAADKLPDIKLAVEEAIEEGDPGFSVRLKERIASKWGLIQLATIAAAVVILLIFHVPYEPVLWLLLIGLVAVNVFALAIPSRVMVWVNVAVGGIVALILIVSAVGGMNLGGAAETPTPEPTSTPPIVRVITSPPTYEATEEAPTPTPTEVP